MDIIKKDNSVGFSIKSQAPVENKYVMQFFRGFGKLSWGTRQTKHVLWYDNSTVVLNSYLYSRG